MRRCGLFCRKEKIESPSRNFVYCWVSAGEQSIYLSGLLEAVVSALPLTHPFPLPSLSSLLYAVPFCCKMHLNLIVRLIGY